MRNCGLSGSGDPYGTTAPKPRGGHGSISSGNDTPFVLLGAVMVLGMHAGFAFLDLGTVRKKNQVNALVRILVDSGGVALGAQGPGFRFARAPRAAPSRRA